MELMKARTLAVVAKVPELIHDGRAVSIPVNDDGIGLFLLNACNDSIRRFNQVSAAKLCVDSKMSPWRIPKTVRSSP